MKKQQAELEKAVFELHIASSDPIVDKGAVLKNVKHSLESWIESSESGLLADDINGGFTTAFAVIDKETGRREDWVSLGRQAIRIPTTEKKVPLRKKPRFILAFHEPIVEGDPEFVHVPIGYVWQQGPLDMHVQFDGPGENNYIVRMTKSDERYCVKLKGLILHYKTMTFQAHPSVGSVPLSPRELKGYWVKM